MKRKPYMTIDERLMVAQWITEERKNAINEEYKNNVLAVCASVAFHKLLNGDIKVWNSRKGEEAYCKVLATAMGHKLAKAEWTES